MNYPLICCHYNQDQSLSQNESSSPPNMRAFQSNNSQQSPQQNQHHKLAMNNIISHSVQRRLKTPKNGVFKSLTYGLESTKVQPYKQPITYKIEQLKAQNKLSKISLSCKRINYTIAFDTLQNRVTQLKNQYIEQENRMANIGSRINKFIEDEQKVSRTTLAPFSRTVIQ